MQLFRSEGSGRPYFQYRFHVKEVTTEMFDWCSEYSDHGMEFRRWHIAWRDYLENGEDIIIQFEWEEPALLFALKFGEYIL